MVIIVKTRWHQKTAMTTALKWALKWILHMYLCRCNKCKLIFLQSSCYYSTQTYVYLCCDIESSLSGNPSFIWRSQMYRRDCSSMTKNTAGRLRHQLTCVILRPSVEWGHITSACSTTIFFLLHKVLLTSINVPLLQYEQMFNVHIYIYTYIQLCIRLWNPYTYIIYDNYIQNIKAA